MKLIWCISVSIIVTLFSALTAEAQAPSSIAGDALLIKVTSGTAPLPTYGYDLFVPATTGNGFQLLGIYNGLDDYGTYTYTVFNGTTAQASLNDAVNGLQATVNLVNTGPTQGTYSLSSTFPFGYSQGGTFTSALGTAPNSFQGKVISGTVKDGLAPFAASGTFTMTFATNGNTYTLVGGGAVLSSSGTYSNLLVNRSTMAVYLTDSRTATNIMYISFVNAAGGQFAIAQSTTNDGFEVGTFTASDNTKPTVVVTSPAAGQRWSNAVFTVAGTAADDVKVTAVYCRAAGQNWTLATTGNGWTNWSGNVTLTAGTNIIQAYAVDGGGNISATNAVSFRYVVTNKLLIRTTGLGGVAPNYSNAWLEIGRSYSITSAPAAGFAFSSWTVSTNWIGGVTKLPTNLTFIMATNLTLQANFIDVASPTLTFTAPTAGLHLSNALATVRGMAADNSVVSNVWCQLNDAAWNLAATTNGWTNWVTILQLAAGTNKVNAYAVDISGNRSLTNSLSFVSSNTFLLKLNLTNASPLVSNGLNFSLLVSTGLAGHIEYSTNLLNWTTLTNFNGSNGVVKFRDAAATNVVRRFYRAGDSVSE